MATTRAVIDVAINTGDAAAQLRNLQSQINSFNAALNKNNIIHAQASKQFADAIISATNVTQAFTAEQVRMETAARRLDQTLVKGKGTIGQYFNAKFRRDSADAAAVLSLANARAQALETQFIKTSGAIGGFRDAIAIRPLQAFNSETLVANERLAIHRAMLRQATTSMINFGKNTQWAGRQLMVGFTVPLTIFGAAAGKTFQEIEQAAVRFKKVYGDAFTPPEEIEANMRAVEGLALEFTKYGIAVKDTISLAAEAAAAGAQNANLIAATTEATRLATLGQMEQQEALTATIALQNAFKLSAQDLATEVNFLNMVENQTVVTLQDLSDAIPRVAPVIVGLGGNVRDLAAMMAAMQEGGVSAAQGANALKSGLGSLINPTKKASETLAQMGININGIVQANRGDLMGTVQAFAQSLSGLDKFTRQQALEELFGKYQYARLGALFDNIVKDGTQASRVLQIAGMSAEQMAKSAEKELSVISEATSTKYVAAMERFKMSIAPLGELFMKISTPIINFFSKLFELFNGLPEGVKNFAALATIITGVVVPAGTMFLGLLMNLIGTLTKFGHIVGVAMKGLAHGGLSGAVQAVSQSLRYMSLEEINAAGAAQQLGISTEFANDALLRQVSQAGNAEIAILRLRDAYTQLIQKQMQVGSLAPEFFAAPLGAGAAAQESGGRPPRVRRRNSGGPIYLNTGNIVPGFGNTDTVPAMLTPGEFVINKDATRENLPLLHAINDGMKMPGFNKGGKIPGMQYFGVRPGSIGGGQVSDLARLQALQEEAMMKMGITPSLSSQSRTAGLRAATGRDYQLISEISDANVRRMIAERMQEYFQTPVLQSLSTNVGLVRKPRGTKINQNLRLGIGSVLDLEEVTALTSYYGKTFAEVPAAQLELAKMGITPLRAAEMMASALPSRLRNLRSKAILKDEDLWSETRLAFDDAGLSTVFNALEQQRGAIRYSLPESIKKTLRKGNQSIHGPALEAVFGRGNVRVIGGGDKPVYVISGSALGYPHDIGIRPGLTEDFPLLGTSYQGIGKGEAGWERLHASAPKPLMANGGGLIPGVQYFGKLLGKSRIGGGKVKQSGSQGRRGLTSEEQAIKEAYGETHYSEFDSMVDDLISRRILPETILEDVVEYRTIQNAKDIYKIGDTYTDRDGRNLGSISFIEPKKGLVVIKTGEKKSIPIKESAVYKRDIRGIQGGHIDPSQSMIAAMFGVENQALNYLSNYKDLMMAAATQANLDSADVDNLSRLLQHDVFSETGKKTTPSALIHPTTYEEFSLYIKAIEALEKYKLPKDADEKIKTQYDNFYGSSPKRRPGSKLKDIFLPLVKQIFQRRQSGEFGGVDPHIIRKNSGGLIPGLQYFATAGQVLNYGKTSSMRAGLPLAMAGRRQRVLVDLDSTIFDNPGGNLWNLKPEDFIGIQKNIDRVHELRANGIDVEFVTARPPQLTELTQETLKRFGLDNIPVTYNDMKTPGKRDPNKMVGMPAPEYKLAVAKKRMKEGYDVSLLDDDENNRKLMAENGIYSFFNKGGLIPGIQYFANAGMVQKLMNSGLQRGQLQRKLEGDNLWDGMSDDLRSQVIEWDTGRKATALITGRIGEMIKSGKSFDIVEQALGLPPQRTSSLAGPASREQLKKWISRFTGQNPIAEYNDLTNMYRNNPMSNEDRQWFLSEVLAPAFDRRESVLGLNSGGFIPGVQYFGTQMPGRVVKEVEEQLALFGSSTPIVAKSKKDELDDIVEHFSTTVMKGGSKAQLHTFLKKWGKGGEAVLQYIKMNPAFFQHNPRGVDPDAPFRSGPQGELFGVTRFSGTGLHSFAATESGLIDDLISYVMKQENIPYFKYDPGPSGTSAGGLRFVDRLLNEGIIKDSLARDLASRNVNKLTREDALMMIENAREIGLLPETKQIITNKNSGGLIQHLVGGGPAVGATIRKVISSISARKAAAQKLQKHGFNSLTDEEKAILREASEDVAKMPLFKGTSLLSSDIDESVKAAIVAGREDQLVGRTIRTPFGSYSTDERIARPFVSDNYETRMVQKLASELFTSSTYVKENGKFRKPKTGREAIEARKAEVGKLPLHLDSPMMTEPERRAAWFKWKGIEEDVWNSSMIDLERKAQQYDEFVKMGAGKGIVYRLKPSSTDLPPGQSRIAQISTTNGITTITLESGRTSATPITKIGGAPVMPGGTAKLNPEDEWFIHGFNMGGHIQHFANGGDVAAINAFATKPLFESANKTFVPGVGNRDTVPAALTPGEFVINKQATADNLPLLQAINSGNYVSANSGGLIPGYAIGAVVGTAARFLLRPLMRIIARMIAGRAAPTAARFAATRVGQTRIGGAAARSIGAVDEATMMRAFEMPFKMTDPFGVPKMVYQESINPLMKMARGVPRKAAFGKTPGQRGELVHVPRGSEDVIQGRVISSQNERLAITSGRSSQVEPYMPLPSTYVGNARQTGATRVLQPDTQVHVIHSMDSPSAFGQTIMSSMQQERRVLGAASKIESPSNVLTAAQTRIPIEGRKPITSSEAGSARFAGGTPGSPVADLTEQQIIKELTSSPQARKMLEIEAAPMTAQQIDNAARELGIDNKKLHKLSAIFGIGALSSVLGSVLALERNKNQEYIAQSNVSVDQVAPSEWTYFSAGNQVPGMGNKDTVPAMLTPGEFVVNKKATGENLGLLHAINDGNIQGYQDGGDTGANRRRSGAGRFVGGMGAQLGIGLVGGTAGAALGGSFGGDTGAMIGSIAGGIIPGLLLPTSMGGLMGSGAGAAAALANPITGPIALAVAAIAATTYTFYKLSESNMQQFEAGRRLADAMTTTSSDLEKIGETARQRSASLNAYLDATESAATEEKFNRRIARAKTKAEKKRLEEEKRAAVDAAGGTKTRRQATEEFYKVQIAEAKRTGKTGDALERLYEQRNMELGVRIAQPRIKPTDTTFGEEFIKGVGKETFQGVQAILDISRQLGTGELSQAQYSSMLSAGGAAYGMSVTPQGMAEQDLAMKLSQYILSGQISEDQAASIAAAIGKELKNYGFGERVAGQVTSTVGAEGRRAEYSPGLVAERLAEVNQRRVDEFRNQLNKLVPQFYENVIDQSGKMQQREMFLPQFFSGMADQMRRVAGSLMEAEVANIQMLEENIAAVSLRYDDLIAKASTVAEKERLRYEQASALTNLQERLDKATEDMFSSFGGTAGYVQTVQQNQQEFMSSIGYQLEVQKDLAREQLGAAQAQPLNFDNLNNAIKSIGNIGNIVNQAMNVLNQNTLAWFNNIGANIGAWATETGISTGGGMKFSQMMAEQFSLAAQKKFEGTTTGAELGILQEMITSYGGNQAFGIGQEGFFNLNQLLLTRPEIGQQLLTTLVGAIPTIESLAPENVAPGAFSLNAQQQGAARQLVGQVLGGGFIGGEMLDPEVIAELTVAINSLPAEKWIKFLQETEARGKGGADALQRLSPLYASLGQALNIQFPTGETIFDRIQQDSRLLTDDQYMMDVQKGIDWYTKLPESVRQAMESEIGKFSGVSFFAKIQNDIDSFDTKKFNATSKSIRNSIKNLIDKKQFKENEKDFKYIIRTLDALNKIKDPKIRAQVQADISPLMDEALRLLQEFDKAVTVEEKTRILNMVIDVQQAVGERVTAGIDEGKKDTTTSGGGGTKEDPLGDQMRSLRDRINTQAKLGTIIEATGQKAKSIFARLRGLNLTEGIMEYFKSLDPKTAIKVGEEVLKSRGKLNTLLSLMSQEAVTAQQEAAAAAKNNAKFAKTMAGAKSFTGLSAVQMAGAFQDQEFISGLQRATAGAKNNKEANRLAREYAQNYIEVQRSNLAAQAATAPTVLRSQASMNTFAYQGQIGLQQTLGITQEEASLAMQNDQVQTLLRNLMESGKSISDLGAKERAAILDFINSQKTVVGEFNKALGDVEEGLTAVNTILQDASAYIDEYNIKPLQKQLDALNDSSANYQEENRRLSNALSKIQEQEDAIREAAQEKEKAINDTYNDRVKALEDIQRANNIIAAQQKGQLDVASALSRGDIGAAAQAALAMQQTMAQQRQDEIKTALSRQRDDELEAIRLDTETKIKNLAVEYNGELLNREQIEKRIKDNNERIYQNSLRQWDLEKQISAERERQQKIADQQARIERVQTVAQRLGAASQEGAGKRADEIALAISGLRLQNTPEATAFADYLQSNKDMLNTLTETDFTNTIRGQAAQYFQQTSQQIGADITSLVDLIKAPVIDTAKGLAEIEGTTAFQKLTTDLDNVINTYLKTNPFQKVMDGFDKFMSAVEGKIRSAIPAEPGAGGGTPNKKPEQLPGPGLESSYTLRAYDADQKTKDKRANAKSKTEFMTIGDQKFKVTAYYDEDGNKIPGITKFETLERIGTVRGQADYGYQEVDQRALGSQFGGALNFASNYNEYSWYPGSPGSTFPHYSTNARPAGTPALGPMTAGGQGTKYTYGGENASKGFVDEMNFSEIGMGLVKGFIDGAINSIPGVGPLLALLASQFTNSLQVDAFKINSPSKHPTVIDTGKGINEGIADAMKNPANINIPTTIGAIFALKIKTALGIIGGQTNPQFGIIGIQIIQSIVKAMSQPIPVLSTDTQMLMSLVSKLKTVFGILGTNSSNEQILALGKGIIGMAPGNPGGIIQGMTQALNDKALPEKLKIPITAFIAQIKKLILPEQKDAEKDPNSLFSTGKQMFAQLTSGFANNFDKKALGATIMKLKEIATPFQKNFNEQLLGTPDTLDNEKNSYFKTGQDIMKQLITGLKSQLAELDATIATINASVGKINSLNSSGSNNGGKGTKTPAFGGFITRAFGGNINYKGSKERPPGFAFGSFVPGIGNSDKVPALLTPGEFVVRKPVAQAYRSQLEALNGQVNPQAGQQVYPGIPTRYRSNGIDSLVSIGNLSSFNPLTDLSNVSTSVIDTSSINANTFPVISTANDNQYAIDSTNISSQNVLNSFSPVQYTYNVSVNAKTGANANEIAQAVSNKLSQRDQRTIRGTKING